MALHSVIERIGGWPALCTWSDKDWNINEGRLIESYEAALLFKEFGSKYLLGLSEMENNKNGFKNIDKPVLFNIHKADKLLENKGAVL